MPVRGQAAWCPPASPGTTQDGGSSPATPGPPFHMPAPGTLISSGNALAHLDLFPRAWATSPQLSC